MSDRTARDRRDRVAAVATVVAVLAVGATFAVARADRGDDDPGPAPSSDTTGIGPCVGGDLVAGGDTVSVARGTRYLTATLGLAPDTEPCVVEGYPSVIALSNGLPAGVETTADRDLGDPRRLVVLPDRPAKVTIGWPTRHYCGPVLEDAVRLWVAPDLALEVRGYDPAGCGSGERRAPLRVGAYAYVEPTAEQGTITGVVTLNSGPGLGTGEFVTAGTVRLDGSSGSYRVPIGPNGSYEGELPPERYVVTVTTPQWAGGKPYPAGSREVVGGELTEVNITLPLR